MVVQPLADTYEITYLMSQHMDTKMVLVVTGKSTKIADKMFLIFIFFLKFLSVFFFVFGSPVY